MERAPVKNGESDFEAKRVHYSPHHAVVWKDRETSKVRLVYNWSAKSSKQDIYSPYFWCAAEILLEHSRSYWRHREGISSGPHPRARPRHVAIPLVWWAVRFQTSNFTGLFSVCDHHPQFLAQPFHTIWKNTNKVNLRLLNYSKSLYALTIWSPEKTMSTRHFPYTRSQDKSCREVGIHLRKWNSNSM